MHLSVLSCVHSSFFALGYWAGECPLSMGVAPGWPVQKPAIHIDFVCHQGMPFLPSTQRSAHGKQNRLRPVSRWSKYSTSAGCCTRRRPQKANATGLETRTSSSDFGAIRRYARESEPAEPATQSTWSGVVHPKQARAQYQALREQVPLQEHNASVTYQANKLALNPMPEFPIHALEGNLMSCLCNCCQQPARSTLATSALWKTNHPHSYP